MRISEILDEIRDEIIDVSDFFYDLEIEAVCYDSRKVSKNALFVAIGGFKTDGNKYIGDAARLGAVAVVSEKKVDTNLFFIRVRDSRKVLSRISALFYGKSSEKMSVIGITGTNGKTTTSYLIENMLNANGKNVGVIGTVNYRYGGKVFKNEVTTPESLELQRILYEMQNDGVTHVVLEVSSHSIDLFRVLDIAFDVAVFTNLTQDHLDYHLTMEKYGECKARLFNEYLVRGSKKDRAVGVINCDYSFGKDIYDNLKGNKISLGGKKENSIYYEDVLYDISGIKGRINTYKGGFNFESALIGKHNLENILCATGACFALGIDLDFIKEGISITRNVPGRLERIENNKGLFVFIDYAHTPDALENVLSVLNRFKKGSLITVFGCGGDRDRGKRPLMGAVSDRLSDLSIVSSDNPRSENPNEIIKEIVKGIKGEFIIESDRRAAINLAVKKAKYGDTILIAGKGHETYQILGDKVIDFDDRIEARKALFS